MGVLKKVLLCFSISAILASGAFVFNEYYNQNYEINPTDNSPLESGDPIRIPSTEKVGVRSQVEMWSTIHKMANTLIVAEDNKYWGKLAITSNRVVQLIHETEQSGYNDKDRLLEILCRWEIGDFTQGVNDHNYVWGRLGGTVGKAVRLNKKVQSEMVQQGFLESP